MGLICSMSYFKKILKENKWLIIICSFGFLAQFGFILISGDRIIQNEWKILVDNLLRFNEYSFYSFDGHRLPSAYMPPLYPSFLLLCVKLFNGWSTHSVSEISHKAMMLIEILQAGLGLLTCLFIYKICRAMNQSKGMANLAITLYLFFPLTIVQSGQASSINIYLPLTLCFIYFVNEFYCKKKSIILVFCSLLLGVLILARAESMIFLPFMLILINAKNFNIKGTILFLLGVLVIVAPCAYRNFTVFGRITPITLSGGYNLWRGHNDLATSDGYPLRPEGPEFVELNQKLINLSKTRDYEVKRDAIFKEAAIESIRNNPSRSMLLSFNKFVALWIHEFHSHWYSWNNNPAYYLPWFIYVVFFVIGLFLNFHRFKSQIILLSYLGITTIIHMTFFVLPRYRLHLLPILCIYAAFGVGFLKNKLMFILNMKTHHYPNGREPASEAVGKMFKWCPCRRK